MPRRWKGCARWRMARKRRASNIHAKEQRNSKSWNRASLYQLLKHQPHDFTGGCSDLFSDLIGLAKELALQPDSKYLCHDTFMPQLGTKATLAVIIRPSSLLRHIQRGKQAFEAVQGRVFLWIQNLFEVVDRLRNGLDRTRQRRPAGIGMAAALEFFGHF